MGFKQHQSIPKILVGRYAGTPIDQLPMSYLRWMITQNFPKEWLDIAKKKLDASRYSNNNINVTRHAVDMYSLRFLERWTAYLYSPQVKHDGLGTFIAKEAELAWERGEDVSKNRHDRDGKAKEFDGIVWVFGVNDRYPDYKDVITVMPGRDSEEEDDWCGDCERPLSACRCGKPN